MAPHPASGRSPRFAGREHGVFLQAIPFYARWTGRVLCKGEPRKPGYVYVQCHASDCKSVTEYEIVAPDEAQPYRISRN